MADLARRAPVVEWAARREGTGIDLAPLLEGVSQALAEASSGYDATMRLVTRAVATALGGSCLLWLTTHSGGHLSLASVHDEDAGRRSLLEETFGPSRLRLSGVLVPAATVGGVHRIAPITWGELQGWDDAAAPALLERLGPASLTLVPFRARAATAGMLGLIGHAADTPLADSESTFLRQLADRVALAADNLRLLQLAEEEMEARRRSDEARQAGEATISVVSRSGPILLFACDADATILHIDGGLLAQFQRKPEAFVGRNLLEVFERFPLLVELAKRALEGEHIRRAQFPLGAFNLETWATPLVDSSGRPAGFAGIVVDASARVAAEAAVLEAARRQAALVEHASDVILVLTPDGRIHYANPALQRVLGYSWRSGDVLEVISLIHPDDREKCRHAIRRAVKRPGTQEPLDLRVCHANGAYRLLHAIGNNLLDDPAVAGFVITLRDITEESSAAERSHLNAERQAALADLGRWALAGLSYADLVSDAVSVLAEHSGAEVVHVFDALPDADFITLSASHGVHLEGGELLSADPTSSPASFALVTQQTVVSDDLSLEDRFDVPELWERSHLASLVEVPIPGADMPVGILGVGSSALGAFAEEDVHFVKAVANVLAAAAARNRAELVIRQQALQDALTGLPNRLVLAEHVTGAAGAGNVPTMSGAERTVFVLDIDRFKEINNSFGHAIGDLVLLEVAGRLRKLGDPVEIVARLGGDEFALVAVGLQRGEDRSVSVSAEERLASRILSVIGETLEVSGVRLRLRGSIGIASAEPGHDGEPPEVPALLRHAEEAMYQAKAEHSGIRRYSVESERSSMTRLALASELAEAIDDDQLRLDYQPKVRCADGALIGVEALVRWQHPSRELLLPDVFVPIAEQTGIVRELTNWVLLRALAECASWHRAGYVVPVAVNLSAGTVHDPALLEAVMSATARAGLSPAAIELEITESAVMRDPDGAIRSLEALIDRGVRFALDDFGTGYSSLGYLQRLPVASVKVDKSFVIPLAGGSDPVASAIVRAVVELGHSLHLDVIAEGVDSPAAQVAVTALGCDSMQGFYIAQPMDPQTLQRWMAAHGTRAARPAPPSSEFPHPSGGIVRGGTTAEGGGPGLS